MKQQLQIELWILDALLTGKDPVKSTGVELCDLNGIELYYLSDGGYSRVFAREGVLMLDDVSRPLVVDKWHTAEVERVRRRIEKLLRDYLEI